MRLYEKYSTRGCVERQIQHEAKPSAVFVLRHPPSAVFFRQTSVGGALIDILYFRLPDHGRREVLDRAELVICEVICRDN